MSRGRRRGGRPSGSRIHQGLVGARPLIGTPYLEDPELRAEYAREIAPRTAVALAKVLSEVFPIRPAGADKRRRALDLGAGTGAAGRALRAYFGDDLDLTEIDHVPLAPGVRKADITDATRLRQVIATSAPFDVVVAAHVLNELFAGEEESARIFQLTRLVRSWCETLLSDRGTLILIEPALRETSRVLLGVRDQVLAAGLHIAAPCFFAGPCPALLRARDWCHDSAAAGSGSRVDFSYLVVRAPGEQTGEQTIDATLFRIVSDPLPEKGRLRLFGCGASGRHALVRLDRESSAANAELGQLARGDVARVARTTFARDGLRVVKDTSVARSPNRHRQ